jgi:PKD repeat protein
MLLLIVFESVINVYLIVAFFKQNSLFLHSTNVYILFIMNITFTKTLINNTRKLLTYSIMSAFLLLSYATKAQQLAAGTYTICASGCDYNSIQGAVTAMNSGIAGPVTFSIASGTYTTGVTMGAITNTSLTNTVTFVGQGAGQTILRGTGTDVIRFNNTRFVKFEDMTIENTSTSTATSHVLYFSNGDDLSFENVDILHNGSGTSGAKHAIYFVSADRNSFEDCNIENNSRTTTAGTSNTTCFFSSSSFNVFKDCFIDNTTPATSTHYTWYLTSSNNNELRNSHIKNKVLNSYQCCPYVVYTTNSSRNKYFNNRVEGGLYGLFFLGNTSYTVGFDSIVNNNIIYPFYYGIYASNSFSNVYQDNIIDSVAGTTYTAYSFSEGGALWERNWWTGRTSTTNGFRYGIYLYNPNRYSATKKCIYRNNVINITTPNSIYAMYMYAFTGTLNTDVHHNTMHSTYNNSTQGAVYLFYNNRPGFSFKNNIVENTSTGGNAIRYQTVNNQSDIDGNNYICNNSQPVYYNTGSFSLAGYKTAASTNGHGANDITVPITYQNSLTLEPDTTVSAPAVPFSGDTEDFKQRTRCQLFPTVGAYENFVGKNAPTAQFFGPNPAILGSPVVYRNIAKINDPLAHAWYVNGTFVSDSIHLGTQLPGTGGFDTVMLVTTSCGGIDTFSSIIRVDSPSRAPRADFISSVNSIMQNENVKIFDLSQDGPASWNWTISPDSTFDGPNKVPTFRYRIGSATSQNIEVQFLQPGEYEVCLTAGNVRGTTSKCESKYIDVAPVVNMCDRSVVRSATGTIFDNGGPNGNTVGLGTTTTCNLTIDPCADSVYLTFKSFDLYAGYDNIRIFEGKDNKGKAFHCTTNTGWVNGNVGFTGPSAGNIGALCLPRKDTRDNATPFDTFRASRAAYIEYFIPYTFVNTSGFELLWWSKPRSTPAPVAGFEAPADICVGGVIDFVDTSKGEELEYLWDFDGDFSFFEFTGANPLWPFFFPGQQTVTLIVSNCGGIDTFQKTINVFLPNKPAVDFEADNTNPAVNDVVYFKDLTPDCIDDYEWSFQQVGGTSDPTFALGTGRTTQNPAVIFNDTGWYNVTLSAENVTDNTVLTKNRMIYVKESYCRPTVGTMIPDLGISLVKFKNLSNSTAQGVDEYGNFTPFISETIEQGVEYEITVERTTNRNEMDRAVYIDWNGNGVFDSTEMVGEELNSRNLSWTAKFIVPKTSKIGASVLRVAVNKSGLGNKICGQNEYGEYEDYRVFIRPDQSAPIITLTDDSVSIEQGEQFIEPGFAAEDNLDGNVTADVVVSSAPIFSNLVPGTYVFNYNVEDAAGNKAETKNRVVVVRPDATAPEITLNGVLNDSIRVFEVYSDPGIAAATDLVDGDVSPTLTTINNVNTNELGTYTIEYSVVDFGGNIGTITRNVKVYDDVAPNVVFNGQLIDTTEIGEEYIDPSVTITDNYDQGLEPTIVTDLDINRVGTYTIQYFSADNSGNKGEDFQRTVVVLDTKAPEVTILGEETITLEVFDTYEDEGAEAMDNDPINMPSLVTGGTYFTEFPDGEATKLGTYTVTYTSEDSAGNQTIATRNIEVVDTEAPLVELDGEVAYTIGRWQSFDDPGVIINDNYYSATECTVEITGTFTENGADLPGLYTLNYVVVDGSGNRSEMLTRQLLVVDSASSLGTVSENSIKMYPNPTNSNVTIEPGHLGEVARISIIDAAGKEVIIVENGSIRKDAYTVDVSQLNGGIYMVRVQTQNETFISKLNVVK